MTNSFPTFETKQRKGDNSLECKMDTAEPKSVFTILLERQIHLSPIVSLGRTPPTNRKPNSYFLSSSFLFFFLFLANSCFLFFSFHFPPLENRKNPLTGDNNRALLYGLCEGVFHASFT